VPGSQMQFNFKAAMVAYFNSACWLCMDLHMCSVVSGRMSSSSSNYQIKP
jgi:hypothetical protein